MTRRKPAIKTHLKETIMSRSILSRASRAISRAREIWAELDDAQLRLLEIRTGVPGLRREPRPRSVDTVARLEALYAREDPRLVRR
jgi:hypothetical protein